MIKIKNPLSVGALYGGLEKQPIKRLPETEGFCNGKFIGKIAYTGK